MNCFRAYPAALVLALAAGSVPAETEAQESLPAVLQEAGVVADSEVAYRAQSRRPRENFPRLSGEINFEIQNDLTYSGEDGSDRELNDLFSTIEPELSLAFTENFSIETSLTFEPVNDPRPGESREFSRQGLFVEELYAQWKSGNLALRAGKFNPTFGKAFDDAPGLYGVDFAEDYEITERIGAGASYALETASLGKHTLSAESFFADTSNLTRSAFRGRGSVGRADGGPSNTRRLNSYSLGVEGEELPGLDGLTYNLGFVYQAGGRDGQLERDYVAGLGYNLPVSEALNFDFLTEYVLQDNADGEAERIRKFLTASTAANYKDLVLALSYTLRDENIRQARDNNDYLFQSSAGYFRELGIGKAGFELAYLLTREENLKAGTLGLRLSWVVPF